MILAETMKLDGGTMFVILVIFLGIAAVICAVFALGCVWAYRAGRGSQLALIGWGIVASSEALIVVVTTPGMIGRGFNWLVLFPAGALVGQAGLYLLGRTRPSLPAGR